MRAILTLLAAILLGGASLPPPPPEVLLFSHTTGWRHDSIEPAVATLTRAAQAKGYHVVASEDPALFDDAARVKRFAAIVLLSTTTKPKDPASEWFTGARRDNLIAYVRGLTPFSPIEPGSSVSSGRRRGSRSSNQYHSSTNSAVSGKLRIEGWSSAARVTTPLGVPAGCRAKRAPIIRPYQSQW
jgi:nicotinamidase-related amidase